MAESSPAENTDAFAATFRALRTQLHAQIDASDFQEADALRLNALWRDDGAQRDSSSDTIRRVATPSTLLLASLAAQSPHTLRTESLATYTRVPSAIDAIRQSRKRLNDRRERLRQRVTTVQTAMDASLAQRLQCLRQSDDEYTQHAITTQDNALRRLQALFVECIAEMSKAVERARHAASRQTASDEQQLCEQMDALEIDLQWRRFLLRLEEDTRHRMRTRLLVPDAHDTFARSELSHTLAEIARIIAANGPVLDLDERVVVDTLIAVGDTDDRSSDDPKALKSKPSLHFVESVVAAWMDIVQLHRPPSRPSSGSSSSRKPRRPSPPLASSTPVLFSSSAASKSSSFRQVMIPSEIQVSAFPLETPLSCSGVLWLLEPNTSRQLFNSCVYVAAADVTTSGGDGFRRHVVDEEGVSFVSATLLELVQTSYFQDEFLLLLANDEELVDERFPKSLRGSRISQLFIATVDFHTAESDAKLSMEPLGATVLHELCVLYVARGAHTKKSGSRAITSLALADALAVLPQSSSASGSHCCVIRFPRGLLRWLGSTSEAAWVQKCPTLFVQYHVVVETTDTGAKQASTTIINTREKAMALLGSLCSWRSCLDEATHSIAPSGVRVCGWHKGLQSTLDDWMQFTPSMKELKACLKSTEDQSETETVKKMLLQSSSLLQELTSRQLGQSISTFLDFTKQQMANAAFEESAGYEFEDAEEEDDESVEENAVANHKTKLQLMKEVLSIEESVTATMQSAKESGLPLLGLQKEIREFDVDIKTDNCELLVELSRRKSAILQSRVGEMALQRAHGGGQPRMMHSFSDAALTNGRRATFGLDTKLHAQPTRLRAQHRGTNGTHLLI